MVATVDIRYEQVLVVQLDAWIGAGNATCHTVVVILSGSLVATWTIHTYLSRAVCIILLLLSLNFWVEPLDPVMWPTWTGIVFGIIVKGQNGRPFAYLKNIALLEIVFFTFLSSPKETGRSILLVF
jgi:hypothetical protein